MNKKWYCFWSLWMVSLSGCIHQPEYQIKNAKQANTLDLQPLTPEEQAQQEKAQTVTIWVHGTRLSKLVLQNFFRSIPGLQSPFAYNKSNNQFDIAQALFTADPTNFALDDMRMFGWSGKLSPEARSQGAAELYPELIKLRAEYEQKFGFKPFLKIITHSHGGNVVALLVEEEHKQHEGLVIDELILLACPVQTATMNYMKDPMFKKIVAIFSPSDLIQVVDPQGLHQVKDVVTGKKQKIESQPFFSNRCFPEQDNLTQIKVKYHGHGLAHINFMQKPFLSALPHLLNHLEEHKEHTPMPKFNYEGFTFSPTKKGAKK